MRCFHFPSAITGDHYFEGFTSFSDFNVLQGSMVAKVVSHGDIAWAVSNGTVSLGSVLPLEVD